MMIRRCLAALSGLGLGFLALVAMTGRTKETFAALDLEIVTDAICRPGSLADGSDAALGLDPDYVAGKQAVDVKNWSVAIRLLSSVALRDTRNADVQNHLGFSYRNSGKLDLAFKHYHRALQLNPRHRGAHVHLGLVYLMTNNLPKAEENLAALEQICLIPCEEYNDLKQAFESYRQRSRQ